MTKSPPAFTPLTMPQSRTAQLVEQLGGDIRAGRYKPAERLPTEQELMARFEVSRTVVREAVASLKAEGLVVTRQGSGAFVAQNPTGKPFRIVSDDLRSITEILNVLQLRLAVEVEAAGLAATARTGVMLEDMSRCLDRIDEAVEAGSFAIEVDYEFHLAIARATGNPYFERFMRFLGTVLIPRQTVRAGMDDPRARRDYLAQVQAEHRAIFAAIAVGDPEAARRAARAHLEASRERYRTMVRDAV
ncbi:GntR family transcriptional regulator [Aliidongia dinghuensis]|uniref:GntR family transcriptional regulator n=1 Tax=Aliidongia dinghuensis TaxID=1867774 RepID=A0A8J3E3F0_9PROT|nr:FadR/GntR family transcriptional regulator [Aliidongia dinghuensis]GGF15857.1 GntR family transcriptional regulator [Aliidongia dinghuensis]